MTEQEEDHRGRKNLSCLLFEAEAWDFHFVPDPADYVASSGSRDSHQIRQNLSRHTPTVWSLAIPSQYSCGH